MEGSAVGRVDGRVGEVFGEGGWRYIQVDYELGEVACWWGKLGVSSEGV